MTKHWKIPGLLAILTIITGCWLSMVQKAEVDYPYQALSKSEVKQRAGIPDSVELFRGKKGAIVMKDTSINRDFGELLDTSFNQAYIGKVKFIDMVKPLAKVELGLAEINYRGQIIAEYSVTDQHEAIEKTAKALYRRIDTQKQSGYKDHIISSGEYQEFLGNFVDTHAITYSELNEPKVQTEKNSDSLKSGVSVEVSFKAREKVDSFYYHKKDTVITKKDIEGFGDFFYARTRQTIRFGFEADALIKSWLTLRINGEEVASDNSNMGTWEAEIEYDIE